MTMTEKNKRQRKNGSLRSVKWLLASLSVVSTLGLWNLFASQDAQAQAEAEEIQPNLTGDNPVSALPPLPTLVPRGDFSGAPAQQAVVPGKIIVQGALPPNPIAVTRSSN